MTRVRHKSSIAKLFLIFLCFGSYAFPQGAWTGRAPIPTARLGAAAGVINGRLYVAGGCCITFGFPFTRFNVLEVYDPATNTWTTKTPMPHAVYAAATGVINGKLYVAGGQADPTNGNNVTDLQIYDPVTDSWTNGHPLPAGRSGANAGVINGKLYVAGGATPENIGEVNTALVYDPATDTWTSVAPMVNPRVSAGTAVINGILYLVGGLAELNPFTGIPVNTVDSYNPATDTWTTLAPMPTTRFGLVAGAIGGKLYAAGGTDNVNTLATLESYDPTTNTWTSAPSMPTATSGPNAGVINDALIVAGGATLQDQLISTVQAFSVSLAAQQPTAYITNFNSNTVSVIDTSSNSVVATVPVGTGPVEAAGSPDGTRVYVTNRDANSISIIDTATRTVVQTLATGSGPFGVSFTPDGTHAYLANNGGSAVQVIDTATGSISRTVIVGFAPIGVAVTPDGRSVYVANFLSNSVSVIDTASNKVTATVPAGPNPNWVAITPDGAFAYVTNFGSNTVSVIETGTNTVVATVTVGSVPLEVAISPDGTRAYVTSRVTNNVSVISTANNAVLTTIPVGFSPAGIAITPDGRFAYVANQSSAAVSVIDTTNNSVSATVPVQINPFGVAIVSSGAGGVGSSPSCTVKNTDVITQLNGTSLSSEPTGLILSFIPPSGLSLNQFASQCGFTGFDWVMLIDQWPGPSGLFAELAPTVPIIIVPPQPPQNDPPAGGYTYVESRQPPFAGAFPFYYNPQSMATSCAVFANGNCAEPIINNQIPSVTFFDAPVNSCLPGGAFFGNTSECQGTLTSPSFMSFRTILVGICNSTPSPLCSGAGQPSAALFQVEWIDDFNGTTGGIPVIRTASSSVPDPGSGTGGLTITSINGTPQAPPNVSCSATPTILWPPVGKEVAVNVSGTITPGTSAIAAANLGFSVIDSEGQVQPSGPVTMQSDGTYSITIPLVASREGTDKNGRQYTIVVAAADNIGNVGSCSTVVTVPHDQGN